MISSTHRDPLARVDGLIYDIYDTILSPEIWATVLLDISSLLGSVGAIVFERTSEGGEAGVRASRMSSNYTREATEAYLTRCADYERDDQLLFERSSLESDDVELVSDVDLWRDGTPVGQRPNVRFLKLFGLRHRAAALLTKDDPSRDRFSIQFSADRGPMTEEESSSAKRVLPHVAKALALARLLHDLEERHDTAFRALDRLRLGVAIVDRRGRTAFRNTEFARIAEDTGVIVRDRTDRLVIREPKAHARLAELLTGHERHGQFGARPRKEAIIVDPRRCGFRLVLRGLPPVAGQ